MLLAPVHKMAELAKPTYEIERRMRPQCTHFQILQAGNMASVSLLRRWMRSTNAVRTCEHRNVICESKRTSHMTNMSISDSDEFSSGIIPPLSIHRRAERTAKLTNKLERTSSSNASKQRIQDLHVQQQLHFLMIKASNLLEIAKKSQENVNLDSKLLSCTNIDINAANVNNMSQDADVSSYFRVRHLFERLKIWAGLSFFNLMMMIAAHRGDIEYASELFEDLQLHGLQPNSDTLHALLLAHERVFDNESVLSLMSSLPSRHNIVPSQHTYALAIKAAQVLRYPSTINELLDNLAIHCGRIGSPVIEQLLVGAEVGNISTILHLFNELKANAVCMTPIIAHLILSKIFPTFTVAHALREALNIDELRELCRHQFIHALVEYYAIRQDLVSVEQVLDIVSNHMSGRFADGHVCAIVLSSYSRVLIDFQSPEAAQRILDIAETMRSREVRINSVAYAAILQAHAVRGELDSMCDVVSNASPASGTSRYLQAKLKRQELSPHTFNVLPKRSKNSKFEFHVEHPDDFLRIPNPFCIASNSSLEGRSFIPAIRTLMASKNFEGLQRLWASAVLNRTNFELDVEFFNAMLDVFSRFGGIKAMLPVLTEMNAYNSGSVVANADTYTHLLHAYSAANMLHNAVAIFRALRSSRSPLSCSLYASLFPLLGRAKLSSAIYRLWHDMTITNQIIPSTECAHTYLMSLIECDNLSLAIDAMHWLVEEYAIPISVNIAQRFCATATAHGNSHYSERAAAMGSLLDLVSKEASLNKNLLQLLRLLCKLIQCVMTEHPNCTEGDAYAIIGGRSFDSISDIHTYCRLLLKGNHKNKALIGEAFAVVRALADFNSSTIFRNKVAVGVKQILVDRPSANALRTSFIVKLYDDGKFELQHSLCLFGMMRMYHERFLWTFTLASSIKDASSLKSEPITNACTDVPLVNCNDCNTIERPDFASERIFLMRQFDIIIRQVNSAFKANAAMEESPVVLNDEDELRLPRPKDDRWHAHVLKSLGNIDGDAAFESLPTHLNFSNFDGIDLIQLYKHRKLSTLTISKIRLILNQSGIHLSSSSTKTAYLSVLYKYMAHHLSVSENPETNSS